MTCFVISSSLVLPATFFLATVLQAGTIRLVQHIKCAGLCVTEQLPCHSNTIVAMPSVNIHSQNGTIIYHTLTQGKDLSMPPP